MILLPQFTWAKADPPSMQEVISRCSSWCYRGCTHNCRQMKQGSGGFVMCLLVLDNLNPQQWNQISSPGVAPAVLYWHISKLSQVSMYQLCWAPHSHEIVTQEPISKEQNMTKERSWHPRLSQSWWLLPRTRFSFLHHILRRKPCCEAMLWSVISESEPIAICQESASSSSSHSFRKGGREENSKR